MIEKFRKIAAGNRIREVIIAVLIAGWISSTLWLVWVNKQQTLVCIVNGATSYIGYADPVSEDKSFHEFLSKLALHAIFNRTPDGYSDWEIATRVLNTPIQNSLIKDKAKDDAVFRNLKITQSFVPYHTEEIPIDSNTSSMMIKGNIQRDMIRDGEPKTETTAVRVMLLLKTNPLWQIKGRQAMIVTQLQVDPI